MKEYYVYEWFNVDSGVVFYVGKGSGNRYKDGICRSDYFKRYLNKYNCCSRIVIDNLSEREALERESELISFYRSLGQAMCNISDGGDQPPVMKGGENPTSRKIVQLSLDGKFIKRWDCIQDASKSLKVGDSLLTRVCKCTTPSAKGFLWVYNDEYDTRKEYKYEPKNNAKKIYQFDVDGTFVKVWDSAVSIEKELGFRRSGICGCCKGKYKTSNGYVWSYTKQFKKIKRIPRNTSVVMLSLEDEYITTFNSPKEALNYLGLSNKGTGLICNCCRGISKSSCGYKWMYEYDYIKRGGD